MAAQTRVLILKGLGVISTYHKFKRLNTRVYLLVLISFRVDGKTKNKLTNGRPGQTEMFIVTQEETQLATKQLLFGSK